MAREKGSNFTTEASNCEEENATIPAFKIISPPGKKKVFGKRNGDVGDSGGGQSSGGNQTVRSAFQKSSASHGGGKNGTAGARGIKTLGWFLNEDLFENANKTSESSSSSIFTKVKTASETLNERARANKAAMLDEGKKRSKRARQRQMKKLVDNKTPAPLQVVDDVSADKFASKIDYYKEDYWYYDPASNGYYYEQMGSRGWRRHSPAAEQKRILMEQEMYAKLWREASGMPMHHFESYSGNATMNMNYYTPQIKYDAESDGYYFEMPSVDGWKKRQPHSNSSSSVSSSSSISKNQTRGSYSQLDEVRPMSYGAALARGQLPPAYAIAPNVGYIQEPFSSDTSSMTTLSEGTPTPPPRGCFGFSGLADQDSFDAILAEHYDNAMKLDDHFSSAMTGGDSYICAYASSNHSGSQPSLVEPTSSKKHATSYADVAAASCGSKEKKNEATSENVEIPRPTELEVFKSLGDYEDCNGKEEEHHEEHELLLNFNADKFITDLLSCYSNPERMMRDLAVLKTPVANSSSRLFAIDSPSTPEALDSRSAWSTNECQRNSESLDSNWCVSGSGSVPSDFNDIWALSGDIDYQPAGKSKLSIWCNNNLISGTLVDNK